MKSIVIFVLLFPLVMATNAGQIGIAILILVVIGLVAVNITRQNKDYLTPTSLDTLAEDFLKELDTEDPGWAEENENIADALITFHLKAKQLHL